MAELIQACTQSPVNLVLTVLLGLIVLYWLFVGLAGIGMDSLDLDLDLDADVDVASAVAQGSHGFTAAGFGLSFLRLLGLGDIPLLVLLSFQLLFLWIIGVLAHPVVGEWSIVFQLIALIPSFVVALLVTVLTTWPLRVMFRQMKAREKAEQKFDFIGKRVRLLTPIDGERNGQAEIDTDGAPLKLIVRATDTTLTIDKGAEAVIVSEDSASGVYVVRPF